MWVVWHNTFPSCHRGFFRSRGVCSFSFLCFSGQVLRGVCSFSFLCFSGQVLRKKTMFECHVILGRIFQQISKISKIVVDHRMPLHPLPGLLACRPWQASQGSSLRAESRTCCGYILTSDRRCIEQPPWDIAFWIL